MSEDLVLPMVLLVIALAMPVIMVIQLLVASYLRMLRQWKWDHREPIRWPSIPDYLYHPKAKEIDDENSRRRTNG